MEDGITRDEAFALLKKYNKESFHIQHGLTVEGVMRCFARECGYGEEEEHWGIVGLLHDIDFEQYPEQHCIKAPELLRAAGVSEDIIHSVCSHGYELTVDIRPEHEMEKVLYAVDELTGLIGAAADDPECMVELICDGYHIHPSVIRTTFKMFGPERVILISDSMRATGMANGTYELGGQEVTVKDRKAVLKDGTLAGSATDLFGCMRKAMEFGVPVEQAIWAATRNPARSIGIYDRTGSVHVGKEADLLLVTPDFELKQVISDVS